MNSDFVAMKTVFVVKNCAPHGWNPFFLHEKSESEAMLKEYVSLLMKQYYTISPPFPHSKKGKIQTFPYTKGLRRGYLRRHKE